MIDPIKEAERIITEYEDGCFYEGKTFNAGNDEHLKYLVQRLSAVESTLDKVANMYGVANQEFWAYLQKKYPDISKYHVNFNYHDFTITVLEKME